MITAVECRTRSLLLPGTFLAAAVGSAVASNEMSAGELERLPRLGGL